MKKIISIIALLALFVSMDAQTITVKEVPQPVLDAYAQANPSATNPTWMKEGNNFQVWYQSEKTAMFTTYTSLGKEVEKGWEIDAAKLPLKASEYLKTNFAGEKATKVRQVTDSTGATIFRVEIKGKNISFDNMGNLMSS